MSNPYNNQDIQWAQLTGFKKSYVESIKSNRDRTWLWMHLSGVSPDWIAIEYKCSKKLVITTINRYVRDYKQKAQEERERRERAASNSASTQPIEIKTAPSHVTVTQGKPNTTVKETTPALLVNHSTSLQRRIYAKLKRRLDTQFDKKYFIGDIVVSDEEYAELLSYTRSLLRNVDSGTAPLSDDPLLAITLVQIGIRCYDGNYWNHALEEELRIENTASRQYYLGESFIRTMRRHGKHIISNTERVQTILFHSFVTNYYAKGLFELLYQYYARDLERDINRNDRLQMQALMDTLKIRSELSDKENDALDSQFSTQGSRAYRLRKHTLQAISANPVHSSMRLRRFLRLIDRAFWKESVPKNPVSRLTIQFKEWADDSAAFRADYRRFKMGEIRNRGKKHFSSPYLHADITRCLFSVQLPAQIVRGENSDNLFWRVTTLLKSREIQANAYPVFTGYKTEDTSIAIGTEELFGAIHCELFCNDRSIRKFDLPVGDVRLFDRDGDYASRLFHIQMCAYTKEHAVLQSPALLECVHFDGILRWDFDFEDGDILILPDRTSMTVGERYIVGLTPRGCLSRTVCITEESKQVALYREIPHLVLTIPKGKLQGTVIDVNGIRHRLGDCSLSEFNSADERGVSAFYLPLDQFEEIQNFAINTVVLDIPGSPYAKDYTFAYAKGFSVEFGGMPYIFSERGTATFPTEIHVNSHQPLVERLQGENGFQFELTSELSTLQIMVGKSLNVELSVPLFMWSTDASTWHTELLGDIWYSEFLAAKKLYYRFPVDIFELGIDMDEDCDDEDDRNHVIKSETQSEGLYFFDLTRCKSWITKERIRHTAQLLLGIRSFDFAEIYARDYVVSCEIDADYDSGQITCFCDIIGQSPCCIDITYTTTGEMLAEKLPLVQGRAYVNSTLENGRYRVEVYEAEEDDSGFGTIEYTLIHTTETSLINKDDFSNWHLQIRGFHPREGFHIATSFAEDYWVANLHKIGKTDYEGQLSAGGSGETIPVQVSFSGTEDDRTFNLSFIEEDRSERYLQDFIFDSFSRCLLRDEFECEDASSMRSSERYRRFRMLFNDDVVFWGALADTLPETTNQSTRKAKYVGIFNAKKAMISPLALKIDEMGLTLSTYQFLRDAGLTSVFDLVSVKKETLITRHRIPKDVLEEIEQVLHLLGKRLNF